jgi:GNAT superfamily N-acetyltransferase
VTDPAYEISFDTDRLDVERAHRWLCEQSYWATGRPRDVTERAFASSLAVGAYDADGTQLGVARAVTDAATFAWIGDVYVDEPARGRGIGTALVRALVDRLAADGVQRFLLGTRDAHEVYARLGFRPVAAPQRFMEIDVRPAAADIATAVEAAFADPADGQSR